jgi:hypothetical protein
MTPGEALLDVPMSEIVERMGRAIAEAQLRLDQLSIRTAILLGETRLDMRDAAGALVSRSLLELGFLPSFYHFTETTIDVSVTLSIRVEESFDVGVDVSLTVPLGGDGAGATGPAGGGSGAATGGRSGPSGPARSGTGGVAGAVGSGAAIAQQALGTSNRGQQASMFGITVSADYHRRYDFNTTAASKVSTKMLSVPPPAVFLDAIRNNFRISEG